MSCCRNHQNDSDQQDHIRPLDAIFGGHDIRPLVLTITWLQWFCAFRAAGQSAPLHKETNCHDDYREYHCDLNYIRQRQVLHLPGLFRQFDVVRVFLIALVFFSQNFFQPLRLPFCNRLIHRSRMVAYEKVLPASVTPERPHLLKALCFLSARLLYCYCPHLLKFSESAGC